MASSVHNQNKQGFLRDCLFLGGAEETGGILVAEEAFYQSLLQLELQNPELLQVGQYSTRAYYSHSFRTQNYYR